MRKFSIRTFGCRCNQADSAAIHEALCCRSMSECGSHLDADLIIVNTCTVTQRADQQARQLVRKLHRENPSARVVVTGCYAERDPEALAAIPGVDLVFGNAGKEHLPDIVEEHERSPQEKIVPTRAASEHECFLATSSSTGGKTRPLVKLQDGCDACCSYCIVPHVRGKGRSARPESVLAGIESLVGRGFQEIVLTGVNLGNYGTKFEDRTPLIDLLRQIVRLPGLGRIRLSSIEPMRFERGIVQLAAQNALIARHFHIPMQSGSDRILRRMRRPYTAAKYEDLVRYVAAQIPNAALGADILVGFPGETDRDFQETYDLVQRLPLAYLHVFPFSPREGTDAYSFPERIFEPIVKQRASMLLELSRTKNLSFRRRFIGRVLPAITLAEEEAMGEAVVLTDNYIRARVCGLSMPGNRLVDVRIDEVRPEVTYSSVVCTSPRFCDRDGNGVGFPRSGSRLAPIISPESLWPPPDCRNETS